MGWVGGATVTSEERKERPKGPSRGPPAPGRGSCEDGRHPRVRCSRRAGFSKSRPTPRGACVDPFQIRREERGRRGAREKKREVACHPRDGRVTPESGDPLLPYAAPNG